MTNFALETCKKATGKNTKTKPAEAPRSLDLTTCIASVTVRKPRSSKHVLYARAGHHQQNHATKPGTLLYATFLVCLVLLVVNLLH